MYIYVTLFDSFYLDKGLVLYNSLERVCGDDFKLYVFCFDERSKQILEEEKLSNAVILGVEDLERVYPELTEIKKTRSKAEFCWTCTPASVEYVLKECNEDNCTYIDADLYFFRKPDILFDEIREKKADIIITPHRFSNTTKDKKTEKRSGKYCVEYNYFNNSDNARQCLAWWKERCFEWCYHLYEEDRMGDQKYLMKFSELFQGVQELSYLGGGVAPWNLAQYSLKEKKENGEIILTEKVSQSNFELVFFHFQNIRFMSETKLNISSETHDRNLKRAVYLPYLKEIFKTREYLKRQYGLEFGVKKIYSSNRIIGFLQGTVLRFRVKSLSDIIDMKKEM